ncbi:MAG: tRNA uridine-5-carboxymethylaminomethyl(34) synthesis enzyme MnmG [Verrucomicrobiota bacterium]|nr:tRNA uridine-5-carboxymethylaminomethyl(34) synthesis enzyme MnmG [Verrucomicrobiota bacterium]
MRQELKQCDVIVVGGGHAGVEAALAAARMGMETLLITMNLDTICQMSCNPAIGGLAKGHLVREIDALGGEMGLATDLSGLQFRVLNRKKGPAVWAPRAQCDKKAYQFQMKKVCERQDRLSCAQGEVVAVTTEAGRVTGIETALGVRFAGRTVILTTGTFLRGLLHFGMTRIEGGRAGEAAAAKLSESLKAIGLSLGRLKTGTPPRLLRRTIDFSKTERQDGDEPVPYFSHWTDELFHVEQEEPGIGTRHRTSAYPPNSVLAQAGGQVPCHITYTTSKTAEIVRANLHKSPLYAGVIKGVGPRYCPSIEDKIVRFADKQRHQLFLEPEGINTEEIYINGLSTSMPYEVQVALVHSVVGCENAEIMRPAYAVEYDYADPTQLTPWLESKACNNLFLAGQINGTSGYEEAAGQGIMAGINAALRVKGLPPLVLGRDQAYIGVLIDDLVTKGTSEPYRMFTSRAEYRLLLRQDNADLRLCRIGYEVGLLPKSRYEKFLAKETAINAELERLRSTKDGSLTLEQVLKRPDVKHVDLPQPESPVPEDVAAEVEVIIKYAGYIERQQAEVERMRQMESMVIPDWVDYDAILGLKTESRQKLKRIRPQTLGQASRISGVSPSDLGMIMIWLKARGRVGSPEQQ